MAPSEVEISPNGNMTGYTFLNNTVLADDGGMTTIERYTGVLVTILLLSAALIGAGLNAALLAAGSRWGGSKRNQGTMAQYGIQYVLAATHIVLCVVWMPMHVAQTLINVQELGAPSVLCWGSVGLWNICLALIIFLTVFLAFERLSRLSDPTVRAPVTYLGVSFLVAAVAASTHFIEYPWNVDYRICHEGKARHGGPLWYSVAAMLFVLIYGLGLLLLILLMALAISIIRRKVTTLMTKNCSAAVREDDPQSSEHTRSSLGGGGAAGVSFSGVEQPSASSSHTHESVSGGDMHKSASSSSSHQQQQQQQQPPPQDNDDEDDDDTFDMKMKMKMKMQKNRTNSGRRHTVANIGLGDSLFGFGKRRGSLEDNRPKVNYNYVRKWSVDITALQDQLENPKTQNRLAFGDLKANLKDKDKNVITSSLKTTPVVEHSESIAEHEEEEEHEDIENTKKEKGTEETPAPQPAKVAFADETETDTDDALHPEPAESDPLAPAGAETNTSSSTTDASTPAIVVLNGSSPGRNHRSMGVGFTSISTNDDNPEANTTTSQNTDEEDEAIMAKYHREIRRCSQCIVLEVVTLLFLLPYALVTLLQPSMDQHLNRNLAAISMAFLSVLSCLHPALLVWMDGRLAAACRRLYAHLTQWRCICYCNIGKGKTCFDRRPVAERDNNSDHRSSSSRRDNNPGHVTVIA